jgi:hypothetical protein
MKRIAIVGLVLSAASLTGVVLAASAAAELPEYVSCQKVAKTGKYENNTCTEASAGGKGKFELSKGFGKSAAFASKAGKSRLESVEVPEAMECRTTKLAGELTGSKAEKNILVTFTGCEAAGSKCTSAGADAGTIVTNLLRGELGYISGKGTKTPVVGVLLAQQEATYSSEFSCEGVAVRIHGPLIAEVTGDINAISAKSTYAFRQSGGLPQYTSFEGGTFLEDEWRWEFNRGEGFEPEGGTPAGLEVSATVSSEALEIQA